VQSEAEIPLGIIQAMLTMIAKHSLNPADISRIYQAYFEPCPPPVELIRDPFFMNMLVDALFTSIPKVNQEHRPKYIYLLAYATSVSESTRNGIRVQSKVELDQTRERLERLLNVLNAGDDLLLSLNELLQLIRTPILAVGTLHHLQTRIMKEDFLGEPPPIFFVLIDQISSHHPNLHSRLFKALCELYDHQSACGEVAEIVMHRQRSIIDRFVHLLFSGYALAVVEKITKMFKEGRIDLSLVRYFGVEVLEIISAPYSTEFIQAMLPIVGNPTVFDSNTLEKNPNVREFIETGVRSLG